MSKKIINIKFQNGLNFEDFKKEVFEIEGLDKIFDFRESESADFVIFGPYKNEIPKKSNNYTRIGYFCENVNPDLSICEWAFGTSNEIEINHPKYKRIQWHGIKPESLKKNLSENDIDLIINSNRKFCNFLYSNPIPYRELFFNELSKYKKVDSPGKSMNNMPSIDTLYKGNIWERKRKFLSEYKFTIAFENYSYPGYQTEKLYDAMLVNSIPIYAGDIHINDIFNSESFINTTEYINFNHNSLTKILEKVSQPSFEENSPRYFQSLDVKIKRKVKTYLRNFKMNYQYNGLDYKILVDKIIEIDKDSSKYAEYLRQPWFRNNKPPLRSLNAKRWIEIFNSDNSIK